MKTVAAKIVMLFLILCSVNTNAQKIDETETSGQTIQFEATAFITSFTINYNYIFTSSYKAKPYFGFGLQYFPHSISNEQVFMVYPQIGLFIGKTHAFETNIGAAIDLKYGEHMPTIYAGYRYFSASKHFILKAGLTMFYLGKNEGDSFLDLPMLFPSPTIGFGYRW